MHPYTHASRLAFWSKAVSRDFDATELLPHGEDLLRKSDKVMSAGSCFAANLIPFLERSGHTYLRTEVRHCAFADLPSENLGYDNFTAAYGNVYTPRQLLQLLRRSLGTFSPREDRWISRDANGVVSKIIDPFRPGLRYAARSNSEFEILTKQHLNAVRAAFQQANVLIFTLGLTEAWMSRTDGAVFPACPGTVGGRYDPELHSFINFGVNEIISDLAEFLKELREINPSVRVILTVSPVPLVATGTANHVLLATTYSKSVLRVAAEFIKSTHPNTFYFPSYEIITGPQAPAEYFEKDLRTISSEGIKAVMDAFLSVCEGGISNIPDSAEKKYVNSVPAAPVSQESSRIGALAQRLAEAECDEAMLDIG